MGIQAGDILITGGRGLGSRLLQWFLHGKFSHSIPMISKTHGLNTGFFRKSKVEDVTRYLTGNHRVRRIRPVNLDVDTFCTEIYRLEGNKYDIKSYMGFIVNKDMEITSKLHCAEATLLAAHAGGVLLERDLSLVSPQTFYEFSCTDLSITEDLK